MTPPTAESWPIQVAKDQGTSPKRKRRFGATIWFGNPTFISSKIPACSGELVRTV
jgi:hypothetical protein